MRNKDKSSKFRVLMAIVMISLFAALLFGCGAKEEIPFAAPEEESPVVEVEKVEATAEPTAIPINTFRFMEVDSGRIETPYGVLKYTEGLSDNLLVANTGDNPYTLEFYALLENKPEVHLFDISLGETSGGNIGMAQTTQGEVPLNVIIYDVSMDESWDEGEILTLEAMQDVINDLIDQLAPKHTYTETSAPAIAAQPEEATMESIYIETPHCTMYYPVQWKDWLNIVHDDSEEGVYKVHFYGLIENMPEQLLFSILLGGDEGEQIGAIMGREDNPVTVNIIMGDLNLSGWYDEPANLLYTMQEASNKLIQKLPLLQ